MAMKIKAPVRAVNSIASTGESQAARLEWLSLGSSRSISGFLQTQDGPRYVAMISNGSSYPNTVMGQILRSVQRFSPCPSSGAAVMQPDVPG